MDINCAHNCKYQLEGKCTKNKLNSYSGIENINDCPYFNLNTE